MLPVGPRPPPLRVRATPAADHAMLNNPQPDHRHNSPRERHRAARRKATLPSRPTRLPIRVVCERHHCAAHATHPCCLRPIRVVCTFVRVRMCMRASACVCSRTHACQVCCRSASPSRPAARLSGRRQIAASKSATGQPGQPLRRGSPSVVDYRGSRGSPSAYAWRTSTILKVLSQPWTSLMSVSSSTSTSICVSLAPVTMAG